MTLIWQEIVATITLELKKEYNSKYFSEIGARGGRSRHEKHGNPGTQEGRAKGGRRAIEVHRKRGDTNFVRAKEIPPIRKSIALAEFMGILFGDGHVGKYQTTITLDSLTDADYAGYVRWLIQEQFHVVPHTRKRKGARAVEICISRACEEKYLVTAGSFPVGSQTKMAMLSHCSCFVSVMKYSPLRELISPREASDCVLRTRRAHGSFVPLRTLRSPGNANGNELTTLRLRSSLRRPPALLPLVFSFLWGLSFLNFFGVEEGGWASFQQRSVWFVTNVRSLSCYSPSVLKVATLGIRLRPFPLGLRTPKWLGMAQPSQVALRGDSSGAMQFGERKNPLPSVGLLLAEVVWSVRSSRIFLVRRV